MKLQPLIVLAVLAVAVAACDKEAITTKPKIKIKSVSSDYVPLNSDLSFTFEFSDKEGDLTQPIHVFKISSSCEDAGFGDSISWAFPDIPGTKNTDGTLEIRMNGQTQLNRKQCIPPPGPGPGPDTLETAIFKFVIIDDAGNISDTAISQPITIEK